MANKPTRQPAREMRVPGKVEDQMNDEVADANVGALRETARQMRELPPGAVVGRDGEILMRKRNASTDNFHVPEDLKDPEWTYEWKVETVFNEPQMAKMVHYAENGWRPVLATGRWKGIFMPNDYTGPIKRDGMVLMERPRALTEQALQEERLAAASQMRNTRESLKLAMPSGFTQNHAGVAPRLVQTYEPGPAPDGRPDKRQLISD